jgi:hypothetical protein
MTSIYVNGSSPAFNWASQPTATYRVLYKNNLTDPAWLQAAPDLAATGSTMTWSDTNTLTGAQRFYVLIQVQ